MPTQTIEEGIKYVISKTQENCKLSKVYQRKWDPAQGEILHSYVHNPAKVSANFALGKIGSLVVRITIYLIAIVLKIAR